MAGFLEKENTVIDMILTSEGKSLLSKGKLRFVYFSLFDDEVDYDPYISNSGTLSAEALSGSVAEQIEASLVREAVSGYKAGFNKIGHDMTNVRSPMFTVKQGSLSIPRLSSSDDPNVVISVKAEQRKTQVAQQSVSSFGSNLKDIGYFRFAKSDEDVSFFHTSNEVIPSGKNSEGIVVRVYRSGSGGYTELDENRDTANNLVFGGDLVVGLKGLK